MSTHIHGYLSAHRCELIAQLAEWVGVPSVTGMPEHEGDVLRSANWLAAAFRPGSGPATMLDGDCALPVTTATDGERAQPGHVYVAVPDRHLLIGAEDMLRLTAGSRENRVRPTVDSLFRATARWCGPRVIGVVLSGSRDDGTAGLAAIAQRGGVALIQDVNEARFPGMPMAAPAAVPSAVAASAAHLARLIGELAGQPVSDIGAPDDALIWETDMIADGRTNGERPGKPIALGCPECRGGMYEIRTGQAVHYACHGGHSWSPQSFVAASDNGIEEALWTAVSAMQEKSAVLLSLAANASVPVHGRPLRLTRRRPTESVGRLS